MRILIVDDSRSMRLIIARAIRHTGQGDLQILEAVDGPTALAMAEQHRPDVMLCDLNMPAMSGMEVLQQLRALGNPVRFGLITADADAELWRRAREAGAMFVLLKPFPIDAMNSLMTSLRTGHWSATTQLRI